MSRIDVTKVHSTVALGPPEDVVTVPKVTIYFLLEPGEGEIEPTPKQGHLHVQVIRN